jgi:hypothetical protein
MVVDSQVSITPYAVAEISTQSLLSRTFHPDKIVINDPAGDWIVSGIQINDKTQLSQPAEIPGECFSEGATASGIALDPMPPGATLIMSVSYVGDRPEGAVFHAIVLGYADPGKRKATKPMYRRPQ